MGAGEPAGICYLCATSRPVWQHAKVPKIVLKQYEEGNGEPQKGCFGYSSAVLQQDQSSFSTEVGGKPKNSTWGDGGCWLLVEPHDVTS